MPTKLRGGKYKKAKSDDRVQKDRVDQVKARTKPWVDVVKGLKEDESKTTDSD